MKKLEEYATPETDSVFNYPVDSQRSLLLLISRNLERKLAMCRDVLNLYDDAFCDGPENCGCLRFEEIYEQARITLEATEPK